nr:S-layer homology domain-containing protein [Oscillospiraceae bacterium]
MKQIRQTVALLLALLLLAAPVRGAEISYKDVKTDHWAYASIRRAGELKLIGGVGGGYFGVGRVLTRAEYAMMLCRLMDWTMLTPAEGSFTDNRDKTTWYYSAVETAYANGVLRKVDGKAGVEETITREEMAAMTVRALGYASLAGIVQEDCPFKDVSTNRGYITLAYHMGFMDGVWTNRFAPALAATREQAAVVLLRVYDALHATVREVHVSAAPAGAV